jgi:hypothetical protein
MSKFKEILPNEAEKEAANWLQSLFNFPTTINYYIYDYGIRNCGIIIEAANEEEPPINCPTDHYRKGPNSIKLHEFAINKLPMGEHQWYSYSKGFFIPYRRVLELKERNTITPKEVIYESYC